MSTAILQIVKKWTSLSCVLASLLLVGCKGSEFARQEEIVAVQYYGDAARPHTAAVRWQVLDEQLMQSVCKRESLNELNLISSTRDGSLILKQVATLPNLEMLNIIEVPLDDSELEALSQAQRLTSLELSRTGITGEGLRHLAKLPLKRLVIRDKHLSLDGLQAIASMTELEELELAIPDLHLADFPKLASSEKLTTLKISDGYFSFRQYGGLKWLVGAPNLKNLHLSGINLNDRSLESIGSLRSLQNLTIEKCVISEDGIRHLAALEHLRFVDIPVLDSLSDEIILGLAERVAEEMVPQPIRS